MLLILGGIGEPSEGERTARQSVAQGSGAAAAAQIREAFRSELSIAALSHRGRGFLPPGAHVLGDAWLVVLGGPRGVLGGWQRLAWEEEETGERPASRYGHSATAMLGGDVFVFGGMMLEEEEEAWAAARSSGGALGSPVCASSSAWILRGVVSAGGGGGHGGGGGGRDAHQQGQGVWQRVRRSSSVAWPPPRAFHTSTATSDAIIVFGGRGRTNEALTDMWLYRERNGWSALPPAGGPSHQALFAPVFSRVGQSAVSLPASTSVLTFGGVNGHGELHQAVRHLNPPICAPTLALLNRTGGRGASSEIVGERGGGRGGGGPPGRGGKTPRPTAGGLASSARLHAPWS